MHRTAPTTKNYPVQNVYSALVQEPCSRSILITTLILLLIASSLHKLLQTLHLLPTCQALHPFLITSTVAFS